MTQTKVDTSREAVEYSFNAAWSGGEHGRAQLILRALLDAKEAAERKVQARDGECQAKAQIISDLERQLAESRAAAAATWEAGWASHGETAGDTICEPNPHGHEALRAVKEAVWEEGYRARTYAAPNPYAKKDTV